MKKYVVGILLMCVMMSLFTIPISALKVQDEFYFNDYVTELTEDTYNVIMSKAPKLYEETGIQVVVAVTDFVVGSDIQKYATEVYNDWGIGGSKDNIGFLLLVAMEDGDVTIAKGKGTDKYISDSRTGDFLDDYFMGYVEVDDEGYVIDINDAVVNTFNALVKVSYGELADYATQTGEVATRGNKELSQDSETNNSVAGTVITVFLILIILTIVIVVIVMTRGRSIGSSYSTGYNYGGHNSYGRGRSNTSRHSNTHIDINVGNQRPSNHNNHNSQPRPRPNITNEYNRPSTPTFKSPSQDSYKPSAPTTKNIGGGGKSVGGGASRPFSTRGTSNSTPSSSRTMSTRSGSSGNKGSSSGGGASRSFKKK